MAQNVLVAWEGREYDHNPKHIDWYWSLGIIAVASTIAALLFGGYLFALLIVVAAVSIALHASHLPPIHQFSLTDSGLEIGGELHPFEKMLSFSVLEDIDGQHPPMLSIKTDTWLSPHLIIPLEGVDTDRVYDHFLTHVHEEEHHPTFVDLVAAWLGF